MTITTSQYSGSLTVQFSNNAEFKLYPWFDESFTAHANLNYPLFGIGRPMRRLFPGYTTGNDESSNVFATTLEFSGPTDGVPRDVCLKLARGIDEVVHLSHEASVYRKELVKLWGIAVPKMYGFFVGHHEDAPVACLLLELCSGPGDLLCDTEEFMYVPSPFPFSGFMQLTCGLNVVSRLAMQNVRKVHTLGITQNMPLELHHFVVKDNNVLLVDFSRAVTHQCNAVPICSNRKRVRLDEEDSSEDDEYDCGELMTIAKECMRALSVSPSKMDCVALVA
jgi:hypothetical protein